MKKVIVTALFACVAVGAFALDFSAGAGGAYDLTTWSDLKYSSGGNNYEVKPSQKPIDIKAFVDATYLQASVGYMMVNETTLDFILNGSSVGTSTGTNKFTYLTLAAYLKYPFAVGSASFFPLLGVEYKLNLTLKDSAGNDVKSTLTSQEQADLNELWVQGGVGGDILIGKFFIRPEILVGFKPLSKSDNDTIAANEALGYTSVSVSYFTINLNLLVGYRF